MLFVIFSTPVRAEDSLSTGYYVKACSGSLSGYPANEQIAHCLGYIRGFVGAIEGVRNLRGQESVFCFGSLNGLNIKSDIVSYIAGRGDMMDRPFGESLLISLVALYSCQNYSAKD